MSGRKIGVAVTCGLLVLGIAGTASAQIGTATPPASRDKTWGTVSSVTMVAGAATQLLMPRLFYSDPEVTQGWKARWHVSVLAPVMTLAVLSFANEYALKDAIKSPRPDCVEAPVDDKGNAIAQVGCATYGGPSTHSFAAFSALGHGAGVFLFDTTKWSDGRLNGASLAGNVITPLVLALITGIGRGAGNYETTAHIVEGGVGGLAIGFLTGMTYSLMQRPECGYTGSMICW